MGLAADATSTTEIVAAALRMTWNEADDSLPTFRTLTEGSDELRARAERQRRMQVGKTLAVADDDDCVRFARGRLPDMPAEAVGILSRPGRPARRTMGSAAAVVREPVVELHCRSEHGAPVKRDDQCKRGVEELAALVYRKLYDASGQQITAGADPDAAPLNASVQFDALAEPWHLGNDSQDRWIYVVRFKLLLV